MIYKSAEIKNENIDDRPMYYESLAGNVYIDRLDGGSSVGNTTLMVASILNVDKELDVVTELSTTTFDVNHKLNYIPQIIGMFWIHRDSPIKQVFNNQIIDTETDIIQHIWIENIKENKLTIGYNLFDLGGYGQSTVRIKLRIFLLDAEG